LAGDLAYQEVPESQLRDSTGLRTGFAFKPTCSGWAPKRTIEFHSFYMRFMKGSSHKTIFTRNSRYLSRLSISSTCWLY